VRLPACVALFFAASMAMLTSCQEATEVRVRAFTDVAHADSIEVAMWVGAAPFQGAPVTSTKGPWDDSGSLGYIVAVPPSDNREANLDVRLVMGIGRDPRSCSDTDRAGCIVAKRAVRYLSRRRLELPITLFAACAGVVCDAERTCNAQGRCVDARVDSEACATEAGCAVEGDPSAPPRIKPAVQDAGAPDVKLPDELPPPAPVVSYRDLDPSQGITEGTLLVRQAAPEALTQGFEVQWANEDGGLVGAPFLSLPRSEITSAHTLLAGTKVPPGADHLSVRAYYNGRSGAPIWSPAALLQGDNYPKIRDVGATAGRDSFVPLGAYVDKARSRVFALGFDGTAAPALRSCDLQGGNCQGVQLEAKPALRSEFFGTPAFDEAQRRVIFPVSDVPSGRRMNLLVCNDDGKKCTQTDLSAISGTPATTAFALVDEAQGALFVATSQDPIAQVPQGGPLGLFRCTRQGSDCKYTSLPFVAQAVRLALGPDALYVVATSVATGRPNILRCARDGTTCEAPRPLPSQPGISLDLPVSWATWDAVNARLLLTGGGGNSGRPPILARCTGDLLTCTSSAIAVPSTSATLSHPRLVVATQEQKLYLVSGSRYNYDRAVMIRCALDGTNCLDRDLSVSTGQADGSGLFAVPALDAAQNRMYVVTRNSFRASRPWLFRCAADLSQGCTTSDMSSPSVHGETASDGYALSLGVESAGQIVLATNDTSASERLSIFSCDARGRECSSVDGSASQGPSSAKEPTLLVSQTDATRTVITRDQQAGRNDLPTRFVCAKGGPCTAQDIAGGVVPPGQHALAVQQDAGTQELRVLLGPSPYRLRCAKGAASCAYEPLLPNAASFVAQLASFHGAGADLVLKNGSLQALLSCPADQSQACALAPLGAPGPLDKIAEYTNLHRNADGTLVSVGRQRSAQSPMVETLFLARCAASGAPCSYSSIVANTAGYPFAEVRVAVDELRGYAYTATLFAGDGVLSGVSSVHRCRLGDLSCAQVFASTSSYRSRPDILIDAPRDRLLVALQNADNFRRPEVVFLNLW
jgi:hypothetical protein